MKNNVYITYCMILKAPHEWINRYKLNYMDEIEIHGEFFMSRHLNISLNTHHTKKNGHNKNFLFSRGI